MVEDHALTPLLRDDVNPFLAAQGQSASDPDNPLSGHAAGHQHEHRVLVSGMQRLQSLVIGFLYQPGEYRVNENAFGLQPQAIDHLAELFSGIPDTAISVGCSAAQAN